jgi:hypothetical protein
LIRTASASIRPPTRSRHEDPAFQDERREAFGGEAAGSRWGPRQSRPTARGRAMRSRLTARPIPSCVGHATANWFEMMLRRHVGRDVLKPGEQLDGDAIWRKARALFYPPREGGVGWAIDGPRVPGRPRARPPCPRVRGLCAVHMDVGMISRMLRTEPVLQGTAVHAGWQHPSPESGQIPFKMPDPKAGHATCIVGVLEQDGEPYVLFQNSWGANPGAWAATGCSGPTSGNSVFWARSRCASCRTTGLPGTGGVTF